MAGRYGVKIETSQKGLRFALFLPSTPNLQCKLFSDNEDYRLKNVHKRSRSRIDPAAVCYRFIFNTLSLERGRVVLIKGLFPDGGLLQYLERLVDIHALRLLPGRILLERLNEVHDVGHERDIEEKVVYATVSAVL
jgi:hypothetical protein